MTNGWGGARPNSGGAPWLRTAKGEQIVLDPAQGGGTSPCRGKEIDAGQVHAHRNAQPEEPAADAARAC